MSSFLQPFAERFATLDVTSLHRLDELYSQDVHFQDPLHRVEGLAELRRYFESIYLNVRELRYDFYDFDEVAQGSGYLRWTLNFRHARLAGGGLISLDGCSFLRWSERVDYHRDYFDAGALLYEHLPVMGGVIGWLKRRLA